MRIERPFRREEGKQEEKDEEREKEKEEEKEEGGGEERGRHSLTTERKRMARAEAPKPEERRDSEELKRRTKKRPVAHE